MGKKKVAEKEDTTVTEVEGEVTTTTPEDDAEAEAAFAAGHAAALTGVEPDPVDKVASTVKETDKDKDGDKDVTAPDPAAGDKKPADGEDDNAPASITRGQLNEMQTSLQKLAELENLSAELRKVQGRMGEFNDRLNKAGGPRKITKENLKHLMGEYEDVAELLAKDFETLFPEQSAANFMSKEEVSELVSQAVAEVKTESNIKLLNYASPGWHGKMYAGNKDEATGKITFSYKPDFLEFMKTMPQAEKESFLASDDPEEVSGVIKKFDEHKIKVAKDEKARLDKQKKLEDAIAPKGGGAPSHQSTSEEDEAFLAGHKAARGGR